MNKRGKAWHLIVTALLIVVFSFTALFGVSYTYGDTKNVYIKGAEDIRFGIDIRGGVDVTFMPADGVEATDDQMTAAKTVIEDRLVGLGGRVLLAGKGYTSKEMKHTFPLIAKDFAAIPVTRVPKVKVGVVGEIYVKYSPLGNNDLQKFLESQDCEVNFPGLMGFVQYCIFNMGEDHVLYGGKLAMKMGTDQLLNWLDSVERSMLKAEADAGFYAPGPFKELVEKPEGIISLGAKMGEGWLLTAEMIELVQGGYGNIVCAQPFGCLPNHIVGKGMVNKIRAMYPGANITPIDYDPSATRVNQENRIKLMLAVAKERLNAPAEAKPLTAEEIAGGAPSLSHV